MDAKPPSIFEAFNAKNLEPEEVAKTFIPPESFDRLFDLGHTLVVGPRGSGKTTLLKMLKLPALRAWPHPEAHRYRSKIAFTGVFIPVDVTWKAQTDALGRQSSSGRQVSPQISERLKVTAFTTHVLLAMIDAIRDRLDQRMLAVDALRSRVVQLTRNSESALARLIAKNWVLTPDVPSLAGITLALRDRMSGIAAFAERAGLIGETRAVQEFAERAEFHVSFFEALLFAMEAFEHISEREREKWALLFDELEICPEDIRRKLLDALRSTDRRVLFKLSLSPYTREFRDFSHQFAAAAGEDYSTIELWYSHKEDGYKFSYDLIKSVLRESGCEIDTAEEVFGSSRLDVTEPDPERTGSQYQPGSIRHSDYLALSKKDPSFSAYLSQHGINVHAMNAVRGAERSSYIRKVAAIVAVRNAFRGKEARFRDERSKPIGRSRKKQQLYTGATALFAIAEGNPRWLIGLCRPLVRQFAGKKEVVSRSFQLNAIEAAGTRFCALLSTIPIEWHPPRSKESGLFALIDQIGDYFYQSVVVDDFVSDPPLTFRLDDRTPIAVREAVGLALNAGAVVYIPNRPGQAILGSLENKRFRLSYLLAPHFRLPLTTGKSRHLSTILNSDLKPDLFDT